MDGPDAVKERYAAAALGASGCCGERRDAAHGEAEACCGERRYDPRELDEVPAAAAAASLGCANPVAAADLREGEVVLDLGSGGGIDVLLSARRVGPTGMAFGLDMTKEMVELARTNQSHAGIVNAEFLLGDIESIPLPERSVDVVISNCVINLSFDKRAAFDEMFRVLKPAGRIAVADIVADREPTAEQRADVESRTACLAGALTRPQYERGLREAGLTEISFRHSHEVAPGFASMIVHAVKPAG